MGLFGTAKRSQTLYLVEVPHEPWECTWVMDEIIGRAPQYQSMFWWGCQVQDHRAWAFLDGSGPGAVLEEALPPVLRGRALVHRLDQFDSRDLRRRHEERDERA